MLIYVSCGIKQDHVKGIVEGIKADGVSFTFKDKKGIKMCFETTMDNADAAIGLVKKTIKADSLGAALYFSVSKD